MNYQPADEPLHMTVYSLPEPHDVAQTVSVATGRWKLLAIVVISCIPACLAYFAYFFVQPKGQAALGTFLSPARSIAALQTQTPEGLRQTIAQLQGRWLLVSVAGAACPEACQRQLFIQRQLWATLGNDKSRVQRVWLVSDDKPVEPALRQAMGDALVLRVDPTELGALLGDAASPALGSYLYVVDPMGNAMMRFPALVSVAEAGQMHRDLDRLLRVTASWTPPAH
jgi:hypothetical protein